MHELNICDLQNLILDGRKAMQYAWDHYDELITRNVIYTLYGPYDYGIGAAIPGKLISTRSRRLTLKTRKKSHIIYELDGDYKLLRTRDVFNLEKDTTYECFELDGIQYACPFSANQETTRCDEVIALSYREDTPSYLAFLREHSLIAQFFDYVSPNKTLVTAYYYYPFSKYTAYGCLTDPNAPVGALNSSAQKAFWEEEPMYTDFSQWFKKPEEASAP